LDIATAIAASLVFRRRTRLPGRPEATGIRLRSHEREARGIAGSMHSGPNEADFPGSLFLQSKEIFIE
jgi:hypothetical protein